MGSHAISVSMLAMLSFFGFVADALAREQAKKPLAREAIPQGFAIGTGDPLLALKVQILDGVAASAAPSDVAGANVFAVRSSGEGQTTLSIRTDLDVAVKFDLYVSTDGKTFQYTSSCAVTPGMSAFEMWQYPVREFALGNPRLLRKGETTCD